MKRTLRFVGLGSVALTALLFGSIAARDLPGQDAKLNERRSPIEGAWRQIGQKYGDATEYTPRPDGVELIKLVTHGRFVWTLTQNGKIVTAMGGSCKLDKNSYSETVEFAHGGGATEQFIGKTYNFTWNVEGDLSQTLGTMKVKGQEQTSSQKRERCK